MTSTAGPLALVGSGEYLPHMAPLEGELLEGRPPLYVQLATAAVPDGRDVLDKWHRLGRAQAERLGVTAVIVDVRSAADAASKEMAAQVEGAGLIYLSGGHPSFLANTLRDSVVWETIVQSWRDGAALAGCSAGAMVMASWVPSLRHPRSGGTAGLGLLPHVRIIPHFDRFSARVPNIATRFLVDDDEAIHAIGVDEDTALVGGPSTWTVRGERSAWRLTREGREEFPSGSVVTTPE